MCVGWALLAAASSAFGNALGVVFVSYRASDGRSIARDTARALRAYGVPVWLDETDLPPGDIDRRLEEALAAGLAGAVFVITPGVDLSATIRCLEAPALRDLANDPRFTLAIINAVADPSTGRIDRDAPDRVLGLPPGTLAAVKQYRAELEPESGDGIRALARWMALRRLGAVRSGREREPLLIDVQSRAPASARAADGDLVFRTVPPVSGRLPDRQVWEDLQAFLASLPRAIDDAGARAVRLRGGSHLSIAFALGAEIPATTRWRVAVEPTRGDAWEPCAAVSHSCAERLRDLGLDVVSLLRHGRPLAVYVDMNESEDNGAFARHVHTSAAGPRGHHIRSRLRLTHESGPVEVARAALRIRRLGARQGVTHVDLFLRTPWPVAVLLGRELNTLTVRLYEWDGERYCPVIVVASGSGASAIVEVL